ncbi:MAG: hypothetical protein LBT02_01365 [Rickettsiales bacterium]|jgi:hypothetical protein|nr:hypothetical protein [Rickettsiales bacterium]
MEIDFKHLKKEIFDPYIKIWSALGIILLYLIIHYSFADKTQTNNITKEFENSMYIGNGVVINKHQMLANKSLMEDSCWDRNHFQQGNFYAIDDVNIYQLGVQQRDSNSDLVLLKIKNGETRFRNFAILDNDRNVSFNTNKRLIIPQQINEISTFKFKNTKIVENNINSFTIVFNGITRENFAIGLPIFNENYVLQGIVKEINNGDNIKIKDKIAGKIGIKTLLTVNKISVVRNFLDKNRAEYFTLNGEVNVANDERYDVKKSILNIFCILEKKYR